MTDEQPKFHVVPNEGADAKREAIPKRLRFEVFKRDAFRCQYCGQKAPDVILHCDHIKPIADGGEATILNLITACASCNLGKGARKLDEHHVLEKARAQLEELSERRTQLEMLVEWHQELSAIEDMRIAVLAKRWIEITEGAWAFGFTKGGENILRRWLHRFTADELMTAMDAARTSYFDRDENDAIVVESTDHAFNMIPAIANVRRASRDKPHLQQFFYIRGILRRRFDYVNEWLVIGLMDEAVTAGADIDRLTELAKRTPSWNRFRSTLEEFIAERGDHSRVNET